MAGRAEEPLPRRSASEGPLKLPQRPSWRCRSQSLSGVGDGVHQQRPWRRHHSTKPVDMGCRWRTFSYDRLPQALLRLSIVRLDGSSFDVHVARTASVAELKLAVEEIFSGSQGGGRGNVSWSHVWGHFCLCYMNHKLTDNKTLLGAFGIKEGDKLHFIRHLSINCHPVRHPPRKKAGLQPHEQRQQM